MTGKGEDRAQGFAEQSVKKSAAHPSQSSPDHHEQGDRTQSDRSLTGNDHREDSRGSDPDRPKPEDRYKP
ncbi:MULTISPECIES: hypothetical protein [Microvirga]|uniref:hypothetical protein n=1 Tax=Microvirga TaxID=186650 RepID=UPI001CFF6663|nr:hypothetical protein [Microvirga lenta]MCB5177603.1 hypothetical protein [Microvirga lenta]